MSERARNGWSELRTDAITALDAKAFEQLCYELVAYEAYRRHEDPDIEGPAGDYTADQGRDIWLQVTAPPRVTKAAFQERFATKALTDDHVGATVYSCKAGKNWLDDALKDAARFGQRALEVLAQGGHFKLLLSQPAPLDRTYKRDGVESRAKDHLVRAFQKRLGPDAPPTLATQVEILGVQKLRDFLVNVAPEEMLNRWSSRLGLERMLHDIDAWLRAHQMDRSGPSFAYDASREGIRDELVSFFDEPQTDSIGRAARLLGPPGIGKTRLVLESLLARPTLGARLRAALSSEQAAEAFQQGFWLSHPQAVVVVDDCPDEEVRGLAATFAAKATHPDARLLLITPTKESSRGSQLRSWTVEPLLRDQAQRLLEATLAEPLDERAKVAMVSLAEGFPWFVILLAQEAARTRRGPRSMNEAVEWVLASGAEAHGEAALGELRQNRARALLAIALTRSVDWNNLDEREQDRLVRAVGLSQWPQLRDLASKCHERGLVRLQLGWHFKYVTPAILEREVIQRLLGPKGTDPGGSRLFREAGAWAQQLFERLPTIGLSPDTLRSMGAVVVHELRALQEPTQLVPAGLVGARLILGATWFPRECAHELRRLLRASADLATFTLGRRDVVAALEQIVVLSEALEDIEASLFLLALAENESYSNRATVVWAGLFLVQMSFAAYPLEPRLALLRQHIEASSPRERRLALEGVQALLTTPGFRLVPPGAGEPTSLPANAILQARQEAWRLLGLCLDDDDSMVSQEARALARRTLAHGGPPEMLTEALAQLLDHVDAFQGHERTALLKELRTNSRLTRARDLVGQTLLQRIIAELRPRTLHERLLEQVGFWGEDEGGVTPDDESLAREILQNADETSHELAWLLSKEAVRARVFAQALGRQDPEGSLVPRLLTTTGTQTGRAFFVAYLRGMLEVASDERFRALLDSLRDDPATFPLFALAAISTELHPSDTHIILEALERGELGDEALLELVSVIDVRWLAVEEVSRLVRGLLGRSSTLVGAALDLVSLRLRAVPADSTPLGPVIDELLPRYASERASVRTDHSWEKLALARLTDAPTTVMSAALALLSREDAPPDGAWHVLHRAAKQTPALLWQALREVLERRDETADRLLLSFRFQGQELTLPTDDVVAWVGDDEQRGRAIVSLVPPAQPQLPDVLRRLIMRFGAESSIARELIARMHSTTSAVPSLARHDADRLVLVRPWLEDPEPAVQALAHRLIRSLEEARAYNEALEEEERLRRVAP